MTIEEDREDGLRSTSVVYDLISIEELRVIVFQNVAGG